MVKALRKTLINAYDDVYLSPLKNKITGYNNVTISTLLTHLFTEYGEITASDLKANEERLQAEWDGVTPYEAIINRFDDCIDYAIQANSPFTASQILHKAELVVHNTGLYTDEMKEWDRIPAAQHNYENFKAHMLLASRTNRKHSANAKKSGFGLSLQKLTELAEGMANSVQQQHEANSVAQIEKDKKEKNSEALVAALTKQVSALTKQHMEMMTMMSALKNNNNTTNLPVVTPTNTSTRRPKRIPIDEGGYCWSHGYLVTKNHTCATCLYPKPGHQIAATRINNMGGSQEGKPV
jgi:hypothetical protein